MSIINAPGKTHYLLAVSGEGYAIFRARPRMGSAPQAGTLGLSPSPELLGYVNIDVPVDMFSFHIKKAPRLAGYFLPFYRRRDCGSERAV